VAHLRDIITTCEYYGCRSRATVQLYTKRNDPLGRYCKKHGQLKLKEKARSEVAFV